MLLTLAFRYIGVLVILELSFPFFRQTHIIIFGAHREGIARILPHKPSQIPRPTSDRPTAFRTLRQEIRQAITASFDALDDSELFVEVPDHLARHNRLWPNYALPPPFNRPRIPQSLQPASFPSTPVRLPRSSRTITPSPNPTTPPTPRSPSLEYDEVFQFPDPDDQQLPDQQPAMAATQQSMPGVGHATAPKFSPDQPRELR